MPYNLKKMWCVYMDMNKIFLIIIVACCVIFCLSFVKNKGVFLLKLILRGGIGIAGIYLLNAIFTAAKIPLFVGVNICSISTISLLGVPGAVLLYGIIGSKTL